MYQGSEVLLSSFIRRVTAYFLVFIQLFLPVSTAMLAVAQAAEQESVHLNNEMMSTMSGISALMEGQASIVSDKSVSEPMATRQSNSVSEHLKDNADNNVTQAKDTASFPWNLSANRLTLPPKHDDTVRLDDIFSALPTLDIKDGNESENSNKAENNSPSNEVSNNGSKTSNGTPSMLENQLAQGVQQVGQILQNGNPVDASINYARSLGQNLLNQQVNDWLNQFGKARIQVGSDKTIDGDILLPLIDHSNSLLFTQAGLRKQDNRHITNLGLGWRQFEDGWMWGVNGFYDYDITGGNSRTGVGGELWMDYLKLGANGYFRLTDWHQSPLREMRDFDERPANGFDIRAEGYFPRYPQLGAYAKYEQYFGDNIHLGSGSSVSGLKNNPARSTFGLSYTPFPLVTLKGQTSRGDAAESQIGLELSYRFGMPWAAQLNPDNVDIARSLAGNRYDFVDRNYNIVMQYRKQELISLQLAADKNPGFAGETVTVTATINSKYGLDHIEWLSPALVAAGGRLLPTGKTVSVTLPAIGTSSSSEHYLIEAIAYDSEGNDVHSTLDLSVIRSPRDVTAHILHDNAVANGRDVNRVEISAYASDTQQPLINEAIEVVFTYATGPRKGDVLETQTLQTNDQGVAVARISSKIAATVMVNAKLKSNGNSVTHSLAFIADSETATVGTPIVEVLEKAPVADGKHAVTLYFPVTDANGNPVIGQPVTVTTTNGASPNHVTLTTDDKGIATLSVTNTTAGTTTVIATVNGESQSQDIDFIAGKPDATTSTFTVSSETLVADGRQTVGVELVLQDAHGNPVTLTKEQVQFSAQGLAVSLAEMTCQANRCSSTLSGVLAGKVTLNPVIGGVKLSPLSRTVTLIADASTAHIADGEGALIVVKNHAIADDVDVNTVQVKVTDAQGNPVQGVVVGFRVGLPAHFTRTDYATDEHGLALALLASSVIGERPVTVTVNGQSQDVLVNFVADSRTATLSANDIVVIPDAPALANGRQSREVEVTVHDAKGNPVSNALVQFSTDMTGVVINPAGITDVDGKLRHQLTSTVAGDIYVTASINGVSVRSGAIAFIADVLTARFDESGASPVGNTDTVANGAQPVTLTIPITDANRNRLSRQMLTEGHVTVNATASLAGASPHVSVDDQGIATITLTSTKTGHTDVTVSLSNGEYYTFTNIGFKADTTTANIDAANPGSSLTATSGAKADNTETNTVTATVTDANGNPVTNVDVHFTTDAGSTVVTEAVTTNAQGVAETTVTATQAGAHTVTATVSGHAVTTTTNFVADDSTANIDAANPGSSLTATSGAKADNTETNTVTATVTDANGNPVPNVDVHFTTDAGSTVVTEAVTTNAQGVAETTVTATQAGAHTVTATVNGHAVTTTTNFVADDSTANIDAANPGSSLTATSGAKADNTETNTVTATVTDANGNPVPNVDVHFTTDAGSTVVTEAVTTNAQGVAETTVTATQAGAHTVTATVNGHAVTTTTNFVADDSTANIDAANPGSSLTATSGAKADNTETNTVTATVTDANGNPVPNVDVHFTTDAGSTVVTEAVTTNAQGVAETTVTATQAGAHTVTATVNGHAVTTTTNFVADDSTANIDAANPGSSLTATSGAKADNTETNTVTATVTDANGNPVPNVDVHFTTDAGSTVVTEAVTTNAQGVAETTVTATQAGAHTVTATVSGHAVTTTTNFVADDSTANIDAANPGSSLTATSGAKADNTETNTVTATVTDANGNPVPNVDVHFTTDAGSTVVTEAVTTNAQGVAETTVTATQAGAHTVTATVSGHAVTTTTNFVADDSTANIDAANPGSSLTATSGAKADNTETNTVTATVTDANGNPVPNVDVHFTTDAGSTVVTEAVTTNAQGVAETTVTATQAGAHTVTATVNGHAVTTTTNFVADDSTANIDAANPGSSLTATSGAKADNTETNTVTATVTDANGNPVPNVDVHFTTDAGSTVVTEAVTTNAQGVAETTVTATQAGAHTVTATVNGHAVTTTTNFVADDSTANIDAANPGSSLTATSGAKADNTETNTVTATVTDANGNPVPNVDVHFTTDAGSTVVTEAVTTNAQGVAETTVTATQAGAHTVTATVNGHAVTTTTNFVADDSTANIDAANPGSSLTATSGAKADNTETNTVTATVTDANGNPVPNVDVHFTTDAGSTVVTEAVTTNAQGVAETTVTATQAGAHTVTATVSGHAVTTTTNFVADDSTANIDAANPGSSLTATSGAKADNTETNTVTATVTDANGNPVPNVDVHFTTDAGSTVVTEAVTTNAQGVAETTVTATQAGAHTVTATVSGHAVTTTTNFVADDSTANIDAANPGSSLTATSGAKADNTETNTVTATVTDANGNPVPNVDVHFTTDAGSTVVTEAVTTNAQGVAETTVTATQAGAHTVTATVNGHAVTTTTNFVADDSTANIDAANPGSSLTATSGAKADNTETNTVTATVTDANGNPVPNVDVHFTTDAGSTVVTEAVTTNAQGVAETTVTATQAGAHTVTATVNGHAVTTTTNFVADDSTANIDAANPGSSLTATSGAKADNTETNTVTATVTDANGNPVPNVDVHFTTDAGSTVVTEAVTTNAQGVAETTVTATQAGAHTVTATVNGHAVTTTTNFVADDSTANIDAANPGSSLTATSGAKADNTETNTVTATVTDANGNPVPNVDVHFTTDAGSTVVTEAVTTNAQGVAETTVTATQAGAHTVTATVNGHAVTTTTNFVADDSTANIDAANPGSSLTATSGAKADNTETNTVTATVTDANGNPVPNVDVHFTTDAGSTVVTEAVTTNAQGVAETTVTATQAGAHTVTATVNGHAVTTTTNFVADDSTANIRLTATSGAKADNIETNTVTATVTDANGNPIEGTVVLFSADTTSTIVPGEVTTDDTGGATTHITSSQFGSHIVTAEISGHSADISTVFIAESGTAVTWGDYNIATPVTKYTVPTSGGVFFANITVNKTDFSDITIGEVLNIPFIGHTRWTNTSSCEMTDAYGTSINNSTGLRIKNCTQTFPAQVECEIGADTWVNTTTRGYSISVYPGTSNTSHTPLPVLTVTSGKADSTWCDTW